jgi:hypothetical protein
MMKEPAITTVLIIVISASIPISSTILMHSNAKAQPQQLD